MEYEKIDDAPLALKNSIINNKINVQGKFIAYYPKDFRKFFNEYAKKVKVYM